ncbi:DUF423 domain-containing protein [Flavobacterium agricola]|uniref:DUF423 domain-containing protein n=1 Tax=Flavobacterium agricola TaxID=2870839 RepID=A0ABY6M209_9FLAO|nr:DUF423 domain-containing protein [Flavobacterium agricola]UYW01273.1 DUF423 domain-containing protein [Flavobacterium agricola]
MNKKIIVTACLFGALAIVLGAFGAHGLKKVLLPNELETFEVGVRYQFYQALFLLFVANLNAISERTKKYIAIFSAIGVVLFSGSIYLLATQSATAINFKFLGPITPIGGVFLIVSWVLLLVGALKSTQAKN